MGFFDSSSSSTQKQESVSQSDNSVKTLGANATQTGFSNIKKTGAVSISSEGIDGSTMLELMRAYGLLATSAIDSVNAQGLASSSAIADVARSSTGTESEAGRLINKLAIPAMIGFAVIVLLRKR